MKIRWLAGALALLFAVASLAQTAMYRYRNAQGVLVVDFSIPPEFVARGYDVVSPSGRLIRTVPRQDDRLSREALEKRKAQEKEDAFILRSYSTLDDIEFARQRKRSLVDREIAILEANLKDFAYRREHLRQKAAAYQASGQQAPENIAQILADLDVHEENTYRLLDERRVQLEEIDHQFARYGERLVLLRPSTAQPAKVTGEKDVD